VPCDILKAIKVLTVWRRVVLKNSSALKAEAFRSFETSPNF
jgi:hypothetical protein